jgi:hypothetical protein
MCPEEDESTTHILCLSRFVGLLEQIISAIFLPITRLSSAQLYQKLFFFYVFAWGKGRPVRKADNLTVICESIV